MNRFVLALVMGLAGLAGTASADVFRVVPTAPVTLPSAAVPNLPGALGAPVSFTAAPTQTTLLPFPALQGLWRRAGAAYGVPWQVLGAINRVESDFGRNMGPSSAGAIGWMQFMPSTWLRWGVDADSDGVANPWSATDAVYSAARYLAASGGQTDIARAVFSYNHAQWYVDEVLQLAGLFDSAGLNGTVSLDQLGQQLGDAQLAIVRVNRQLVGALRVERLLRQREAQATFRADREELLSDRLAAQKRAVRVGVSADAAAARVSRLKARLEGAEATLRRARQSSRAASFASAAGPLLQSPTYDGNYVFPVGGGPTVVSVSHTHHDYPAADIVAPAGTPVYALSDGVVLSGWRLPSGRCGIGLTMQTGDGQTWTYCHLAYLEPAVTRGAMLTAGDPVGLVGQTGHATGPHLHLQLQPATSYPQQQPWFQRLAGTAFRWSDTGGPDLEPAGPAARPVFRVMGSHSELAAARQTATTGVIAFRR